MTAVKMVFSLVGLFFIVLLLSSIFTIQQGQQGILLRLGRLVDNSHSTEPKILLPGLHIKVPFMENARIFDTRLQTLDIKSSRIVTQEKKDVIVDYYVKWQIANLVQYFKSTGGNEANAENLLAQQLNTSLRAEFGKRIITDLVSGGRDDVMGLLQKKAQQQASGLGIAVVDVRVKGIELPPNTSNAVYQRMRADMQKIANRHRADGVAAAEAIQASADAQVTILLARARSEAALLKAAGQAKASAIYTDAYSKNKEFFAFYRSLKAYRASFQSKQDLIILDQNSDFFTYFTQPLLKHNSSEKKNGV